MIRLGKGKDHTILRDARENEMYWKRTLNYQMSIRQVATVVSLIFVFIHNYEQHVTDFDHEKIFLLETHILFE